MALAELRPRDIMIKKAGLICVPLELSNQNPRFQPFSCFGYCETAMNSPISPPKKTGSGKGIEPVSIAVVCLLFLGFLGYMGFRNLPVGYTSGGYVNISAVLGEWQAAGRPWHILFRADKTIDMSSGGSLEPDKMEPGTFLLWTEGNVLIKMQNGRAFTATFRELTPNQFDLVDANDGAVTVFKRIP